ACGLRSATGSTLVVEGSSGPSWQTAAVSTPVVGTCDPRFRAVEGEFARNFSERGDVGAAVCVLIGGVPVVDLAGGFVHAHHSAPWDPDPWVTYYSAGKPVLALLALQLVDQGLIGLDDPLVAVWPEFA